MFIVVMKPVLGIIAVLLTNDAYKVEARIATLALVELAVGVILYIQIMSRGHEYYNKKYWKYALLINLPLVPHFLSQVILNHSDRIMIQKMVGESAAGVYSLAYSMAMILSMINTSILQAIRPWVFQRIKAGEKKKNSTGSCKCNFGSSILQYYVDFVCTRTCGNFCPGVVFRCN